ncbi:hypothetical protein A9K82_14975 [Enterobacter kobei]|uniref:hypothetical protein n=1 Tax=Enterobacter kobei TaxID=208224 RepID=UPI000B3C857D|nr:hypothetical protein [Enterobacter kobei]OUS59017.1 hypothetical protein A9K83_04465 [Enterobacter kobei]OUS63022.1 hypothetical protein A9K84_16055 [Enterobacter kobei]OUS65499.1 hypothetical protein A9K82_14975 [Enterobacter kobei]
MANTVAFSSPDLPPLTLSDFHAAGLDNLLMGNLDADIKALKTILLDASKANDGGIARALIHIMK